MPKPLIDRSKYDHPEHFDDDIREYKTSKRYVPTPLENSLFELSGHRCTICKAPWMEIHHINELSEGGNTEYSNLIVLCPNCHTRVHSEDVPSKSELKHYKLKQEIAYELPILANLQQEDWKLIKEIGGLEPDEQVIFSSLVHENIKASSQEEAERILRKKTNHLYLQEAGIVEVSVDNTITLADTKNVSVRLRIKLTPKGLKWIRYLKNSNRI